MTKKRDSEILTRVGAGTPMGELMRQFWIPALQTSELARDGDPVRFKLLGEKLIAFRDTSGRVGVMDHRCPHRCASLFFGRNEEGGIRCVYHGWKYDVDGNCLDMANVPPHQDFKHKIKAKAYKAAERNGIVWVYMGAREDAPELPHIAASLLPEADATAFFVMRNCNWLQALEVGIDPAHASYLHRFFEDEDTSTAYGKQFRGASAGSDLPMTKILREYDRPIINVEHTEYGLRLIALREIDEERTHVRVTNQLFPHGFVIPMSTEMTITQWHVPVDDENCYWYAIFTSYSNPVDKKKMRDL